MAYLDPLLIVLGCRGAQAAAQERAVGTLHLQRLTFETRLVHTMRKEATTDAAPARRCPPWQRSSVYR
jgi:hypothetical protein